MAGRDVADLVTQNARELRLVVEKRHDAARDVDIAARERERIHGRRVHDGEVPRKIRSLGLLRETKTDPRHVFLKRTIVVHAHLATDFDVLLLADLQLLVFAHQRELAPARRGVGRARRGQQCGKECGGEAEAAHPYYVQRFHQVAWCCPAIARSSAPSSRRISRGAEPAPISPTRQIFPASGPRPAPISMLNSSRRCLRTAASSTPPGTRTAFSVQSLSPFGGSSDNSIE